MSRKNAKNIKSGERQTVELDDFDRKILGELVEDAGLSYAELGARVGLSAPAVHERVKRLKSKGVIERTSARVVGDRIGKPMLAFVHVDTVGWGKTQELMEIAELPEVEEIHTVAGDTCILMKVRVATSVALEGLLERIYATPGVKGTRTYVVLSTYLERPTQVEQTSGLAAML